ncbi:MAG: hypothetical protein ACE5DL_03880 [Nitrosopumilaceae archaeon]
MFPDKCSITENGKPCVNPPEFIVSVIVDQDEYMVGVTCPKHKKIVSGKIQLLQNENKVPLGKISFSPLKAVGTDCIHGNEDDLIQLDMKNIKN